MTHVESTNLDPLMQGEPTEPPAPLSPQARLDASRAALQLWVLRTYHPERLEPEVDPATGAPAEAPDRGDPPWLSALVDSLSDVPIGGVAARYLRRWWRRHPLRATAELGDEMGRELLNPLANKHPWLLLGGAVVAGAMLGRLRPWRWVSGTAVLSSLIPPISLASMLASVSAMFSSGEPEGPQDDDADHTSPASAQSQSQGPAAPAETRAEAPVAAPA